jgi:hypothetical protein
MHGNAIMSPYALPLWVDNVSPHCAVASFFLDCGCGASGIFITANLNFGHVAASRPNGQDNINEINE